MNPSLQRAYALLVDAMRSPRKKSELEEAVRRAVRDLRDVIVAAGADPDAAWIQRATVAGALPEVLHVTPERDSDGSEFLIAHEDGVVGLDNGQRVGVYHLEFTGIVKVTTELIMETK